jgi:hypothetical protein
MQGESNSYRLNSTKELLKLVDETSTILKRQRVANTPSPVLRIMKKTTL